MRLIPLLPVFSLAAAGCAAVRPGGEPPVPLVAATGADGECEVAIQGRLFSLADGDAAEAEAEMRRLAAGGRHALVEGSISTPYRCIGSVIYRAQRAGFTHVGFFAQSAPAR